MVRKILITFAVFALAGGLVLAAGVAAACLILLL